MSARKRFACRVLGHKYAPFFTFEGEVGVRCLRRRCAACNILVKPNVEVRAKLLRACKAALSLAWEVGTETEDGVHTLLEDSRGDLWRQLRAAIDAAEKPT